MGRRKGRKRLTRSQKIRTASKRLQQSKHKKDKLNRSIITEFKKKEQAGDTLSINVVDNVKTEDKVI